jgi:hypothetical protein
MSAFGGKADIDWSCPEANIDGIELKCAKARRFEINHTGKNG